MRKIIILLFFLSVSAYSSLEEQYFNNSLNYIHNKKYYAAIQEMQKAITINSNQRGYAVYLSYLYYLRGNNNKALHLALKIRQEEPNNILCSLILADIYYQNKNWSTSLKLYQEINKQNPDIKIVNIRLYELLQYTDKELSHKYYLKALSLDKTDLSLFFPKIRNSKINLPNQKNFIIFNKSEKKMTSNTNDIINISFVSNATQNESTNLVIESFRKKETRTFHISFFRHFEEGEVFAKTIISIIVLIITLIIFSIKRKLERPHDDVVLDNYRKNFKEE